MSSYQAITRTIIMLGTIVVGTMAWMVYGPPAETLAPIIDRSFEVANEWLGRTQSVDAVEHLPAPILQIAEESTPTISRPTGPPLRVDSDVEPASHSAPIHSGPLRPQLTVDSADDEIDELLSQLKRLGAVETTLQAWGSTGKTYRCQCRLTLAENPTIERLFDAIDADPREAVEQVLESVRRELRL